MVAWFHSSGKRDQVDDVDGGIPGQEITHSCCRAVILQQSRTVTIMMADRETWLKGYVETLEASRLREKEFKFN